MKVSYYDIVFVISWHSRCPWKGSLLFLWWVKHLISFYFSVILFGHTRHLLQCDCLITFDDFDILASDSYKFKLKDSLLIKHGEPVLNGTMKSFPLDLFD